eukprot:2433672-Ditylum_brightwellii.AAC.1
MSMLKCLEDKIQVLQSGLIDKIEETLGQQDAKSAFTPAEMQCLGKDADGEETNGHFNYCSVVGMMLYLANNSRPDIQFA